ncbi:MAG: GHKL domain-containing protein [Bacteroidetes bacterium]|nr:GHKL domain-containing protein [Bacteroidota bacterium]
MFKKQTGKHIFLIFLSLAIFSVLIALAYTKFYISPKNPERLTKNFQSILIKKEKQLDKILNNIESGLKEKSADSLFIYGQYSDIFNKHGFLILIFKNDTLKYWSDNSVPVYENFINNEFQKKFSKFSNGLYEVQIIEKDNFTIVGLIKIKNDFAYENQYLINEFQKDFKLSGAITISLQKGQYNIFDKDGFFLFSLEFPTEIGFADYHIIILTLIYLAAFIFFIVAIYKAHRHFQYFIKKRLFLVLGFSFDILIIRFITLYFEIPQVLYSSKLFSPDFFANSFLFPSLGDLLVNSIVILSIAFVIHKNINIERVVLKKSKTIKYLISTGLIFIVFVLFLSLSGLLKSLVINSNISFNLNDITGINSYSIIAFICFALLILSFVFLTFRISQALTKIFNSRNVFFSAIILISIIFFLVCRFILKCDEINFIFLIIYISSFWFIFKSSGANIKFSSTIFYLLLFSLYSTYILYQNNNSSEKERRIIIVQKLATERDPVAEYMFSSISDEIRQDTIMSDYIKEYPFDEEAELENITSYIINTYFSNYWENYDFLITICDSSKTLDIQPDNYLINCFEYFENIINEYGKQTESENLFYLDYDLSTDNYLAIIDYNLSDIPVKIVIEIFPKYIPKGLGYPELLIDEDARKSADWLKYSWAKYENGELVYHFGKYFYSMNLSNYGKFKDNTVFFNRNKFNHLFYQVDEDTVLIISKKKPGLLDIAAPFSYIFIFYGLMLFLILLVLRSPIDIRFFDISFKKRLQLSVTALIIASFLFIGIGSLLYIISLNNNKNHDILSEKAHSVLIELEHKLASEESLTPEIEDYLSNLLNKFSLVFFSDINLYDLEGTLLATSRPEIFNKGLISTKMNSEAYNYMSNYKKSLYIHDESIGDYKYLSAYVPFRNEQNKLIAYLNLPYFAKQDELTNEISTFLVAFINIYVILIAIAIFVALVIANYITKPLQLIKDKISRLKLGKANEKIEWERMDEIGSLVMEYNRMVDELANSAELLAKSERESAWREMAKQIAHEIKNPLTPMKLSVQYLQKAWDEKAPDWEKRLNRFTQTIIEQIDSLSIIATEFSDFAKMPKSKIEKTELTEIIKNSIGLYKDITQIRFIFHYHEKHYVPADKEQLLRVFNNLIKNSIQAISNPENGLIEISIEKNDSYHKIKFSDNGKGIPKVQREKVFYPNFTTKSGGMGLGLAMVKDIIQNTGGEITFESEIGKGTTFVISLPVYEGD